MLKNFVAKKTKKEKLLADKRRLLAMVAERQVSVEKPVAQSNPRPVNTFVFKHTAEVKNEDRQLGQSKDSYDYVASDLKKIAVLTSFAICAQVVLWYLLEKHLILLF